MIPHRCPNAYKIFDVVDVFCVCVCVLMFSVRIIEHQHRRVYDRLCRRYAPIPDRIRARGFQRHVLRVRPVSSRLSSHICMSSMPDKSEWTLHILLINYRKGRVKCDTYRQPTESATCPHAIPFAAQRTDHQSGHTTIHVCPLLNVETKHLNKTWITAPAFTVTTATNSLGSAAPFARINGMRKYRCADVLISCFCWARGGALAAASITLFGARSFSSIVVRLRFFAFQAWYTLRRRWNSWRHACVQTQRANEAWVWRIECTHTHKNLPQAIQCRNSYW